MRASDHEHVPGTVRLWVDTSHRILVELHWPCCPPETFEVLPDDSLELDLHPERSGTISLVSGLRLPLRPVTNSSPEILPLSFARRVWNALRKPPSRSKT